MIGIRAAEHGVVELVHPGLCYTGGDLVILVVTSYHSFHIEATGHCSKHA